jgi:hypothetical protein
MIGGPSARDNSIVRALGACRARVQRLREIKTNVLSLAHLHGEKICAESRWLRGTCYMPKAAKKTAKKSAAKKKPAKKSAAKKVVRKVVAKKAVRKAAVKKAVRRAVVKKAVRKKLASGMPPASSDMPQT